MTALDLPVEPVPHAWPTWFVSTAHRLPERQPLGVRHARRSGDSHSACGQVAVGWSMFWLLAFDVTDRDSCPDCARLLGL